MEFVSLDGKKYKVNLASYSKPCSTSSKLHKTCRGILQNLFPLNHKLEEVYLKYDNLYLDFFLPELSLCIEVHGEQHYNYNTHFYTNQSEWRKALARDNKKKEWCELNNITLIILKYDEIEKWSEQIVNRHG